MGKISTKYQPLYERLRNSGLDTLTLTFAQLHELLGTPLPASAQTQRGWWANRDRGSSQASAWMQAGYRVEEVDLATQKIIFARANRQRQSYTIRKHGDTVLWDAAMIKSLRAHMNLNQAQFAEQMGVRQQTVSEWEVGIYEPTRATCKHLALVAESAGFRYGVG